MLNNKPIVTNILSQIYPVWKLEKIVPKVQYYWESTFPWTVMWYRSGELEASATVKLVCKTHLGWTATRSWTSWNTYSWRTETVFPQEEKMGHNRSSGSSAQVTPLKKINFSIFISLLFNVSLPTLKLATTPTQYLPPISSVTNTQIPQQRQLIPYSTDRQPNVFCSLAK